jgi:hypothetical protein
VRAEGKRFMRIALFALCLLASGFGLLTAVHFALWMTAVHSVEMIAVNAILCLCGLLFALVAGLAAWKRRPR